MRKRVQSPPSAGFFDSSSFWGNVLLHLPGHSLPCWYLQLKFVVPEVVGITYELASLRLLRPHSCPSNSPQLSSSTGPIMVCLWGLFDLDPGKVVGTVHSVILTTVTHRPTKVMPPANSSARHSGTVAFSDSTPRKSDVRESCLTTVCSCFYLMCYSRGGYRASCASLQGPYRSRSWYSLHLSDIPVISRQKPREEKWGHTSDCSPFPPFSLPLPLPITSRTRKHRFLHLPLLRVLSCSSRHWGLAALSNKNSPS